MARMDQIVLLRRIIRLLLLIGLISYIAKQSQIPSFTPSETKTNEHRNSQGHGQRKKKEIEAAILKRGPKIVAEHCSKSTNICFLITDTPLTEENNVIVRRSMILKSIQRYAHTIVELTKPSELNWQNFNPRHWQINKYIIVSQYCKLMVAAGFFMEALIFNPTVPQEVLLIGLGGGVMTNFFSAIEYLKIRSTIVEIDPEMVTLAHDWFGHETSNTTNVIVEDGVTFIEKIELYTSVELKASKAEGKKYRSIMVDACYSDYRPIVCPVEEFFTKTTANTLANILDGNGVFTMNILSTRDSLTHEENLLNIYKKHFETCFLLRYHPEKRMLICSHRLRWSWEDQKEIFKKNIMEFEDRFNFNISQLVIN